MDNNHISRRAPLTPGTIISHGFNAGEPIFATVINDLGGDQLTVYCQDAEREWTWEFDGLPCTVVEEFNPNLHINKIDFRAPTAIDMFEFKLNVGSNGDEISTFGGAPSGYVLKKGDYAYFIGKDDRFTYFFSDGIDGILKMSTIEFNWFTKKFTGLPAQTIEKILKSKSCIFFESQKRIERIKQKNMH